MIYAKGSAPSRERTSSNWRASFFAQARSPGDYVISSDALSLPGPYGIMLRRDDPASKKVVDNAMTQIYKSGEINKIYEKWFTRPVPPTGINYNVPMSAQFKNLVASPSDSGDSSTSRRELA